MSPYAQELSRQNKGCFLLLCDQSYSMANPLGGAGPAKSEQVARAMNVWLQNRVIRVSDGHRLKDCLDVGVLGYRTDRGVKPVIDSAWKDAPADGHLASIAWIGDHPLRIRPTVTYVADEEGGELLELPGEMPIWVEPRAEGGTPMCNVLNHAYLLLEEWTRGHPQSLPPLVINICSGDAMDGDPQPYAEALTDLATEDGQVLLFNCHLAESAGDPLVFPAGDECLSDGSSRTLFRMSSALPGKLLDRLNGDNLELPPGSRGFVCRADMVALDRFLEAVTWLADFS